MRHWITVGSRARNYSTRARVVGGDYTPRNRSRKVLYLSAEKFMYQFIRALRDKDAMSFKQVFRSVDVLMIDDVQFFSRKDSTQEEFFHTFNALVDQSKQIVISADRSPSDLEDIEELDAERAGALIMKAREIWFENEEAEAKAE